MARARKKKTKLPRNFEDLLWKGDMETLKAVFDECDLNAPGGYSNEVAIAFFQCPEELTRWLVGQGADIEARDGDGSTPLHSKVCFDDRVSPLLELGADVHARCNRQQTPLHRAGAMQADQATRALLKYGADPNVRDIDGNTPLDLLLRNDHRFMERLVNTAELLLEAQAPKATGLRGLAERLLGRKPKRHPAVTPEHQAQVIAIGMEYEFRRPGYGADHAASCDAEFTKLYALFDVPPVPRRRLHDGKSPIHAKTVGWEAQYDELWELLVPPDGAAPTVQGELIRIIGKVADELNGTGVGNWDTDHRKMLQAFIRHIRSGVPLGEEDQKTAAEIVSRLPAEEEGMEPLLKLALEWIALNPMPIALRKPTYNR